MERPLLAGVTVAVLVAFAVGALVGPSGEPGPAFTDAGITTSGETATAARPGTAPRPRVLPRPPRPEPADRLQWQLGDLPADLTVEAEVFDLDLFETTRAEVAELRERGRYTICYVSAGSWEPYRPDADEFPPAVLGRRLAGFEDERWLDIRRRDVLLPIMRERLDRCAAKGFDGVEFDNVDGWTNRTGFPLDRADQLRYVRRLATEARERGLSPGLKNALGLIPDVVRQFGWALNEQCLEFDECGRYRPFIERGKAVFIVEYEGTAATVCGREPRGTSVSIKDIELDAAVTRCPYRPPS